MRAVFHRLAPPPAGGPREADGPAAALARRVQAAALGVAVDLGGAVEHVSVHEDGAGLTLVLFSREDAEPADVGRLVAALQARSGLLEGWRVCE